MKPIYVAATGQHVGKTTNTLGLITNLHLQGIDAGYCKPVGQQHLKVGDYIADKDAVLFSKFLNFKIEPANHSPVIVGSGVTRAFIDDPSQFNFRKQILDAASHLEAQHDVVVYEGTGHPGVGAVCNLSNAEVARELGAGVIMIVEGGIGSTIDRLMMSTALFREKQVPLIGVIVNKVLIDKMEQTRYYLSKRLDQLDVPLLGLIPYDKTLSYPIMETIRRAVQGKVILNPKRMNNRIEDILAGSLVDDLQEDNSYKNILLVVSIKRLNHAIEKIKMISESKQLKKSPVAGVIVTGDGRHAHWYDEADFSNPYFRENNIPVMTTSLDTYGSVVKISRIEVKINTRTPWKVKRAIALFREHVVLDPVLERL